MKLTRYQRHIRTMLEPNKNPPISPNTNPCRRAHPNLILPIIVLANVYILRSPLEPKMVQRLHIDLILLSFLSIAHFSPMKISSFPNISLKCFISDYNSHYLITLTFNIVTIKRRRITITQHLTNNIAHCFLNKRNVRAPSSLGPTTI